MKFGKLGQITLVVASAFLLTSAFTACGTLTVDFLYVATNQQSPGQIEVYEVNSESGLLRQIPTSPFPSGGRNPVAEAAGPDAKNLYVVNEDDNNVTQFGIGTDGKLYAQSTTNTPGAFPMALAINKAGSYMYVLDTLNPTAGCTLGTTGTTGNPCPGDIAVFPITSTGGFGPAVQNNSQTPNYWPLQLTPTDLQTVLTPTAVNVTANGAYVYVTAWNTITSKGYLFGFTASTDGTLTPMNNGLPYALGSEPSALTSDPTSGYLYVADAKMGQISVFNISAGTPTLQSTVAAGNQPSGMSLFGSQFLYASNGGDGTVSAYAISGGNLTNIATYAAGTLPVAITVDPRQVGYVYTVNFLSQSLSGFKINPSTGTLINTQNSPYISSVQPTAIAGIPHAGTIQR